MALIDSPIPLCDLEAVLAWVDTFKLSRPTKKIGRDFSDAVLLAEILSVHYPKLVEMHNYPPRNSHALKLNNWMTLNRKVLKKLRLNLCCNTMEQLANCAPGVIERVLVMVRDKIRRDEELNRSMRDAEQNMSSGGSYYEACGDEDHVLVVPVKTRVNGMLETVQQKVVNYEGYLVLKEELKDAKESTEVLKQKVDHLDNLLKLKEERIEELQNQLERKQSKRKEALQNSLTLPADIFVLPTPKPSNAPEQTSIIEPIQSIVTNQPIQSTNQTAFSLNQDQGSVTPKLVPATNQPIQSLITNQTAFNLNQDQGSVTPKLVPATKTSINILLQQLSKTSVKPTELKNKVDEPKESRIPIAKTESLKCTATKPSITEILMPPKSEVIDVDRIQSEVFKDAEIVELPHLADSEEFKDSEDCILPKTREMTVEESINKEVRDITNQEFITDLSYIG